MLPTILLISYLLLTSTVFARPLPDELAKATRDLICFDAPRETATVHVTVDSNGVPTGTQNTQATAAPVTRSASLIIISNAQPTSTSVAGGVGVVVSQTANSSRTTSSAATTSASSVVVPPTNGTASGYKNVLYFTNWGIYGANYQPQDLPVDTVTHILYSFADIAWDGEVKSSDTWSDIEKHYPTDSWNDQGRNAYGCVKQLYIHKKKNRHLKVLLSIGGWTYSPKFAPIAATAAGRTRFASSAVKLLADWGLDGLDVDWEYPSNANEARDYILLLQACRDALDAYAAQHAPGHHFLLTVATPAGPQNYGNMDLEGMNALVDMWNLMAYDYAGSWVSTTGHQANIYLNPGNAEATKFSTDKAVTDYLARGIQGSKITLGMPLYGRSWASTSGLGQTFSGVGDGSIERGVWLYKDLPRPGATERYDDVAKASWSYSESARELVSYDTVASVKEKSRYLLQRGLGGAVFWEASGDTKGESSLVGTVARAMGGLDTTENWLSYPASQYENIRAGMPGV